MVICAILFRLHRVRHYWSNLHTHTLRFQLGLKFSHHLDQLVKNLPANAGDIKDSGSIPGLGRSTGEGHGNPLQYSCLGNPMDREVWRAIVYGNAESDTNEAAKPTRASGSFNDSTLQRKSVSCSCPCCIPMLFLPSACWFVLEASGEILWGFHEPLGTVNLCLVGLDSTRVSFLF